MSRQTMRKETLGVEDQKLLNKLLAKNPKALKETELGVLRSRRAYLNTEELENLEEVLGEMEDGTGDDGNSTATGAPEATQAPATPAPEANAPDVEPPKNEKESIQKTLDELGVDYPKTGKGSGIADLKVLLDANAQVVD